MRNSVLPIGLLLLVLWLSFFSAIGQNMVLNPRFDTEIDLNGEAGTNTNASPDDLYEYWDNMPFWQPPYFDGPYGFQHLGSADIYQDPWNCYSFGSSANLGGLEFIVGEIEPDIVPDHMYYFEVYFRVTAEHTSDEELRVAMCYNRPQQYSSESDLTFNGGHTFFNPEKKYEILYSNGVSEWYKATKQVVFVGSYDRIAVGSIGAGGESSELWEAGHIIDDLKLINLGPGGFCPNIRQIENITYEDEVIVYKASDKIIAGTDVGATYTTPGPVIVGGTSNITYRAGEEIQLLDGFGVEAGATFHAFIAPCECEPVVVNLPLDVELCQWGLHTGSTYIGIAPQEGVSYQWTSLPADGIQLISNPYVSNPVFNPGNQSVGSYIYTLTATNVCQEITTENINVSFNSADDSPELDVEFNVDGFDVSLEIAPDPSAYQIIIELWRGNENQPYATYTLLASQDFEQNQPFTWNLPMPLSGCQSARIVVRARNTCSSVWTEEEYTQPQVIIGPGVVTQMNNVFSFDSPPPNNAMMLYHENFVSYTLIVMNRFGDIVYTIYDEPIVTNPIVLWNGVFNVLNAGSFASHGTYYYNLILTDCFGSLTLGAEDYWTVLGGSGKREDPELSETDTIQNGLENLPLVFYPNPTTGLLTLTHSQQLLTVEVYDPLGRQLLQTEPNTNTTSIDLSGQPAGIYIIRAGLEDGSTETHRVVLSPP